MHKQLYCHTQEGIGCDGSIALSCLYGIDGLIPTVIVYFKTSTLTVVEASYIDIQLVAQGKFDENVTVNLTFRDGTASECLL